MGNINIVPKFRFIGSKHALLENIAEIIKKEKIRGRAFFDVFSGSGAVGRYFKEDYSIISNDSLYFSYVLQNALIVLNSAPSFNGLELRAPSFNKERDLNILDFLNNEKKFKGFIYKHYTPASKNTDGVERKYFSEINGEKIDAIRMKIETWFIHKKINKGEYFYLLASLLMAVQKVSNISGTYGAFNKTWDPRALKELTLKPIKVINSKFKQTAFNKDIFEILNEIVCDITYIDPPYNPRQYITNYHLLETIARYDSPKISGKTGIRQYTEKDKSVFCSKGMAGQALIRLLENLNSKCVIISYNSEGLLSKESILEILKNSKFFRKVKVYEFPYRRFKSNNRGHNAKEIMEYVFIGNT